MRFAGHCAVIALIPFLSAVAEPTPAENGNEWTFYILGTETYSSVIPSTVTKIIKTGAGTLTFSANSVDFHGNVEIREGVVIATHFNALGRGSGEKGTTSMNTITVSSDAQLRATFDADKSDGNTEGRGFRSYVVISGDGPDGTGAFYYDHAASGTLPYWLIYELQLAGDASIGGGYTYQARTINLNFNKLTIKTAGIANFYYGSITNPGHITCANNAKVLGHTFNGNTTNLIELSATTPSFTFYSANPINWSMLWSGTGKGTVECTQGGADGTKNVIKGDIDFRGNQLLVWPQSNCGVNFLGSLFSHGGYLEKGGPGTFTLGGRTNMATYFTVSGGTLKITNNLLTVASYLNQTDVSTVRFENAGLVLMTNNSCNVMGRYSQGKEPARLELAGNTDFQITRDAVYLYAGARAEYSAGNNEKTWGTVSIGEGVSMSNNFAVGYSSRGAVYQNGGNVYWNVPGATYVGYIGCGGYAGYGYWGVTNGTIVIPRYVMMAGNHADSTAFFVQRGGTTTIGGENFKVSTLGHGCVYLADGANFTQTAGSTYMGYTDGTSASGGDGTLTADGDGTLLKAAWFVAMQNRTDFTSYININNGAVMELTYVVNNAGTSWTWPSGSKEYVSFDGGIWRTPVNVGRHNAFHSYGRPEPDKFLCQKGGITFDTRNSTVDVNAPIEAPTGKTIKSIALPTDASFTSMTNIGPARIVISDTGNGVGATAFAPFNDNAKALRGDVIVTSKGTGYSAETTSVKVYAPDNDISWDCTFELEDAVSGGVTKYGSGKLAFKCANTYTGKTSVKEGLLEAGVASSIQNGSDIEIAHGATLCISNALSVATIEGSGTLEGGNNQTVTVTDAIIVDAADFNAANVCRITANLVFGENAKIRVSNIAVFEEAPASRVVVKANSIVGTPKFEGGDLRWRMNVNYDRAEISLGLPRGTVVLLH